MSEQVLYDNRMANTTVRRRTFFLLYQMFASTSRRSTCICSIWNGVYSPDSFENPCSIWLKAKQNPTTKFRAHHSVPHTSRAMITRVHASGKQRNLSSLSLITPCALRIHILVSEGISAVWENQNEATFFFPVLRINHKCRAIDTRVEAVLAQTVSYHNSNI